MSTLEREISTYNAKLPELLADAGKFVLIRGDELIGIFDSYEGALAKGYEKDVDDAFLVKRIAPAEHIANFTRGMAFACQ